jgi:hypothetical protein
VRTLLGDEDGAREQLDEIEERLGSVGIELRRRLVEEQELRPQCERQASDTRCSSPPEAPR